MLARIQGHFDGVSTYPQYSNIVDKEIPEGFIPTSSNSYVFSSIRNDGDFECLLRASVLFTNNKHYITISNRLPISNPIRVEYWGQLIYFI